MANQYRVVWKREGVRQKMRVYTKKESAERFASLLGPEPWDAIGHYRFKSGSYNLEGWGPDEQDCCDGYQCGCQGMTVRQRVEHERSEMPRLLWVRLESRPVGDWSELPDDSGEAA